MVGEDDLDVTQNEIVNKLRRRDRLLTLVDYPAYAVTYWACCYTGGVDCIIPKGTILVVFDGISCEVVPEEYERIQELLIPENDRKSPNYGGYIFRIKYHEIGDKFEIIKPEGNGSAFLKRLQNLLEKMKLKRGGV